MFLCLWRSDNPRKLRRRVHQSPERGAHAAGLLECGGEKNLYCPIVPLFPRSHHTPAHPVHLQVSSTNQPSIPLHTAAFFPLLRPRLTEHLSMHVEGAQCCYRHAHTLKGSHQHRSGKTGTLYFLLSDINSEGSTNIALVKWRKNPSSKNIIRLT